MSNKIKSNTLDSFTSFFPITASLSNLFNSIDCLSNDPEHLLAEQDLLINPNNQTQWLNHIKNLTESIQRQILEQRGEVDEIQIDLLGFKLSSQIGRKGYQILVSVYERCLIYFPQSFQIWRDYLELRQSFVLGKPKFKFNPKVNKKRRSDGTNGEGLNVLDYLMKTDEDLEENERDMDGGQWEGWLDGNLGWCEWKALASAHERALIWLPKMPRLWLFYLTLLTHPACPAPLSLSHTRHTFDRALRTLPHGLHERIWKPYLRWSEKVAGGETCVRVWRRYLSVDPSLTAHYVEFLVKEAEDSIGDDEDEEDDDEEEEAKASGKKRPHKALIAAKLLLGLVKKARKGKYKSPDGKSPYQMLIEFMELCERFPNHIGVSLKRMEQMRLQASETKLTDDSSKEANDSLAPQPTEGSVSFQGLVRFAGPPTAVHGKGIALRPDPRLVDQTEAYDPNTDPSNPQKLDIEKIVETEGFNVYKDQLGLIYSNLATYWIKKTEFEKAKEVFETGISKVLTIRDFTTIFDAYAEFSEQYISSLMESISNEEEEDHEEEENELDLKMKEFEELMDRRPFLVNDVLLRRNPNDVQEWEKRIVLFDKDQDEKIVETYVKAIETINPKKATANFNQLFVNFAKWYEESGLSSNSNGDDGAEGVPDLENARKVFERAVKVNFQRVDDLAEIWIEWAEMEVRNENYTEALKVMQRATMIPVDWKKKQISFHDESLPVQSRLFKSLKLWSFRVDLEESIGTVESTQKAYDSIFELKIANAQIVINYANFLEENEYWEESFKVYERGIELFSFPIVFEIWNTYLIRFIKRYQGSKIERARDLFEQALENCPEKFIKPIFLLYAELEENYGLAKRAMSVLERATTKVALTERFDMFTYYIAKATENFGLPATRSIYQRAIECLPNNQTAEMCLRFASLEQKLGEIDRARAIYAHASQFCDPRTAPDFWETYHTFEIQHGSEDTFREMLRIKRAVQASFNTETSYLAAKAAAARAGTMKAQQQQDAMSQLANGNQEKSTMSFVPSSKNAIVVEEEKSGNVDEIEIDDDDDDE